MESVKKIIKEYSFYSLPVEFIIFLVVFFVWWFTSSDQANIITKYTIQNANALPSEAMIELTFPDGSKAKIPYFQNIKSRTGFIPLYGYIDKGLLITDATVETDDAMNKKNDVIKANNTSNNNNKNNLLIVWCTFFVLFVINILLFFFFKG